MFHTLPFFFLSPLFLKSVSEKMLAGVSAQKSALEPFQTSILLLTNALILATIGDTSLFVCAGGENDSLTFGRGRLV